ncbi:MAG: polyprenyl diphosphate synthase [Chloroflexota bacterium]
MPSAAGALPPELDPSALPHHVAIIMDGNGRWARARGLPRSAGHRAGTENVRVTLRTAVELGIGVITLYAFSTENWTRPSVEVSFLLALMESAIDSELAELHANGMQIRHIGRTAGLAPGLVRKIRQAEELTRHNTRLIVCVAMNYGGRAEIVDAVQRLVADGLAPEAITEEALAQRLYTAGLPEPDLVIRTGGDLRLSNFLIWQASYAELYSTPVFWPDFDRAQFIEALRDYQRRQRRFGGLQDES